MNLQDETTRLAIADIIMEKIEKDIKTDSFVVNFTNSTLVGDKVRVSYTVSYSKRGEHRSERSTVEIPLKKIEKKIAEMRR